MVELICLVFPALFSAFSLERLIKKKLNIKNFLFVFVTNVLIINLFSILLVYIFSGIEYFPLTTQPSLKTLYILLYLFISLIVTVATVLLERLYFYRLRIEFSENKNSNESNDK